MTEIRPTFGLVEVILVLDASDWPTGSLIVAERLDADLEAAVAGCSAEVWMHDFLARMERDWDAGVVGPSSGGWPSPTTASRWSAPTPRTQGPGTCSSPRSIWRPEPATHRLRNRRSRSKPQLRSRARHSV